jgi:hypothetical protein
LSQKVVKKARVFVPDKLFQPRANVIKLFCL